MISFINQINDNKLTIELIRKELKIYKGSILGMFWLFFSPFLRHYCVCFQFLS